MIYNCDSYIVFFFHEMSVDNVGAVVRVSPIVSLSKVYTYIMRNTYVRTQKLQASSLASPTYVTSRYLGYRASELSMRIWDRPQLRTCSPEALQLWGHPGMILFQMLSTKIGSYAVGKSTVQMKIFLYLYYVALKKRNYIFNNLN